MMGSLLLWWQARSARERRLIAVMLALAAGLLSWIGVYRPVEAALERAEARYKLAVAEYGAIRARVERLRKVDAPAAAGGGDAAALATAVVEEGFVADPPQALGSGRVGLRVASAKAPALMGWLARMEATGISVETLRVTPASGVGTVTMEAVLVLPGAR